MPFGCLAFSKTRDRNELGAQIGVMKCATRYISFETRYISSETRSIRFEITVCPIMLRLCPEIMRRCPEIMRQNPTLNFLSRNCETLSRNCEILSRNYETASHKNRRFINAERRTRHCTSPVKDAQTNLTALKTSHTTDRVVETCRLDVLITGYRRDKRLRE